MQKLQIGSIILRSLPFLMVVAFFVLQNHFAEQRLHLYLESAEQQREFLAEQMSKKNVSPELGRFYLEVSRNLTNNTESLVSSLNGNKVKKENS